MARKPRCSQIFYNHDLARQCQFNRGHGGHCLPEARCLVKKTHLTGQVCGRLWPQHCTEATCDGRCGRMHHKYTPTPEWEGGWNTTKL